MVPQGYLYNVLLRTRTKDETFVMASDSVDDYLYHQFSRNKQKGNFFDQSDLTILIF